MSGKLKRFLNRPKQVKTKLVIHETVKGLGVAKHEGKNANNTARHVLVYARYLNRCFSSLKAEYTGRYRRRYAEGSTDFKHFVNLSKRLLDRQRRTGVKVQVPTYFRAAFEYYGGDKTYPARVASPKAWYWYRQYAARQASEIFSLTDEERQEYYVSLIAELAETWGITQDEVRKRFGPWVGEYAEVSIR